MTLADKRKIAPNGRGKRRAVRSALLLAPLGVSIAIALGDAAMANGKRQEPTHRTWYVSAAAPAGGDGSARAPFNRLALVQQASGPGDTIVVEPSPVSVPPLDGGITLKPRQRVIGGGPPVVQLGQPLISGGPAVVGPSHLASLPRIANTTNAANSGDAVELADETDVENLIIAGAYRGAIYGRDVVGADLRGNDISGFNTSGTVGFLVQPFYLESYTPFVALHAEHGIPAGWAGILIDTAGVSTNLLITDNYVHDSVCGDGIDIRAMGTGDVNAQEERNFITRLAQCSSIRTLEGLATQVTGSSTVRAVLFENTEADVGSAGANADSVFINPAEAGTLIETVDHNLFVNGIGGPSTNGLEFIISNGRAEGNVTVSNSIFQNDPGDMIEEFNRGESGSTATLTLDHVIARNTTISRGLPTYALPPGTQKTPDNTGECLAIGSVGSHDTTVFQMIDSQFTGCDNNGIEVTNNHATGDGVGDPDTLSLDIDHSRISGSRFYNLWFNNVTPLTNLRVRVEESDLSVSRSGVAVGFDQQRPYGTTQSALIDLGGGALGSQGGNCIFGGAIHNLEATEYTVAAHNNWWGSPSGPAAGTVVESPAGSAPGYSIDDSSPLNHEPSACNGP